MQQVQLLSLSSTPNSPSFSFNVVVSGLGLDGDTPAQVLVEPAEEVSGIRVNPNTDGNGIIITNNLRRHLWAYVYRTGWKAKDDDENAKPHPVEPWEPVLSKGMYIQAVDGFQGTFGTILDAINHTDAYTPVTSDPIILPVLPEEAVRTYYTIVVVGPSWTDWKFVSEIPHEYRSRTAEIEQWEQAEMKMDALTWFQEFFFPAILTVFPADAIGKAYSSETVGEVAQEVIKLITNTYPDMVEQMSAGQYKAALVTFFKAFDNDMLREALVEYTIRAGLLKGGTTMFAAAYLADLNIYVAAIDKFLSAGDLGLVVAQLCSAKRFTGWSATSVKPYVRIQNDPSLVVAGLDVTLTCYGIAGIAGVKEYEWKTSGLHGHLEDTHGHSGSLFTSTDPKVRYVADADADDGDEDFVAVTVYLKEKGQKKELGYAEADVVITDTLRDLTFFPAYPSVSPNQFVQIDAFILPSLPEGVKVEIEWNCTNKYGVLTGPKGESTAFTGEYARFTAGKENGSDSITATAVRLTQDGKRVPLSTKTIDIRVGSAQIVKHSANEMDFVLLLFNKTEGALHYFVTYHTNGNEFPVVPDTWPEKVRTTYNDYYQSIFANIDGKRQEIYALEPGSPYVDPGYKYNPDYPLQPGEAYWIIFQYPSEKTEEFAKPFFNSARDTILKWTADVSVE